MSKQPDRIRFSNHSRLGWALVLCLAALVLAPGVTAAAEPEQAPNQVTVSAAGGRLRFEPSLDSRIAALLDKGARVGVHAIRGDWLLIEVPGGPKGWAHRSLFDEAAPPAEPAADIDPPAPADKADPGPASSAAPPAPAARTEQSAPPVSGRRPDIEIQTTPAREITLNFVDIDVRELLSALAINQEVNIVMAADVTGRVSVHLYRASLTKVLNAVTLAGGFGYRKRDDVYYVYKPDQDKHPQSEWLELRTFKLKYSDPEKMRDILKAVPDIRMIEFHEASKTIIVEDTPENIRRIEQLIARWDARPAQVMIEAKILEVRLSDDMSLGVNWESITNNVRLGTGGLSRAVLPTEATGSVSPIPATGAGVFGNYITGVGSAHQFAVAIDALKTKTTVNVLSTPKLMALHGKNASVQVGGQQGYRVTTTNLGVVTETIKFIDTGTILNFTPFIDEDRNILLNVRPTISSATLEAGIPVVNRTIVSTWLLAKDGETIFIGGLIQDTDIKDRSEIPGLGQLPLIGPLFGRTITGTAKTELIVLITPRIFGEGLKADSAKAKTKVARAANGFEKK